MARCEGCGAPREVSSRQARRIRTGHSGSLCPTCRPARSLAATETDYRYWLGLYGVKVPRGQSALEVVRASGMPPELEDLAVGFVRDSNS